MTLTPLADVTSAPPAAPARRVLPKATLRTLPRVDLLPPELGERQRLKVLQRGLLASVVAAGLVVAGLHAVAASDEHAAQRAYDAQSSQAAALAVEKRSYANVPLVLAQAKVAEAELRAAMGQEVRWSLLLDDLDRRMPDGVWLTAFDVTPIGGATGTGAATGSSPTGSSPTGSSPTGSSPTGSSATSASGTGSSAAAPSATGVASIRFTGSAASQAAVATWLRVLATVPGFAGAYLTSSTEAPASATTAAPTFTFTTTVTVTASALSHRYLTGSGS